MGTPSIPTCAMRLPYEAPAEAWLPPCWRRRRSTGQEGELDLRMALVSEKNAPAMILWWMTIDFIWFYLIYIYIYCPQHWFIDLQMYPSLWTAWFTAADVKTLEFDSLHHWHEHLKPPWSRNSLETLCWSLSQKKSLFWAVPCQRGHKSQACFQSRTAMTAKNMVAGALQHNQHHNQH